MDRRAFLRGAAGTALVGIAPLRFAGVAGAALTLTMANFTRYLNTSFRFQVGGRAIDMPLRAVTDERSARAKATPGSGECFSLIFAGPRPPFAQGTYAVNHTAFGLMALFVVPVGRRTDGQDYQVLFNRCTV